MDPGLGVGEDEGEGISKGPLLLWLFADCEAQIFSHISIMSDFNWEPFTKSRTTDS